MAQSKGISIVNEILTAVKAVKDMMPKFERECDVVIYGNANSQRSDLYWLAVALAFGQIRPTNADGTASLLPTNGHLYMEWAGELNRVRFRILDVSTMLGTLAGLVTNRVVGRATTGQVPQLFTGPPNSCVGGQWQWTPNIPLPLGLPSPPFFTFNISTGTYAKRTLITSNPTYLNAGGQVTVSRSPSPPGDQRSRGSPTIAANPLVNLIDPTAWYTNPEYLIFTSLMEPCGPSTAIFETDLVSTPPVSTPTPLQTQIPTQAGTPSPTPIPTPPTIVPTPLPSTPSTQTQLNTVSYDDFWGNFVPASEMPPTPAMPNVETPTFQTVVDSINQKLNIPTP